MPVIIVNPHAGCLQALDEVYRHSLRVQVVRSLFVTLAPATQGLAAAAVFGACSG